jgi:hypothetical protein
LKHMCFKHFYAIFIAPVTYMHSSARHVQKKGIEGSVEILKRSCLHKQHMNKGSWTPQHHTIQYLHECKTTQI